MCSTCWLAAPSSSRSCGGVVGLVIGLVAYPPTAWFAVLEVGMPAALVGAVLGAAVGALVASVRRSTP